MGSRVKIIVEDRIPYFRGLLDGVADVLYLPAEEITPAAVADADALVTRTRNRCDASLLSGSRVSLIASATIGLDHVDIPWCEAHGITVRNAPGCNAPAVAQYVFASLLTIDSCLAGKTLGVIGAGHVGSIVADWGRRLGMNVLVNDPPRAAAEGPAGFSSLGEIAARASFITVHTPYTVGGAYPTRHLIDSAFVESLANAPVIVNSARGPVTDTAAILAGLADGRISKAVIDCWEGEPDINRQLLAAATVATPHIAGYSAQGKLRASQMAAATVAKHFGLPVTLPAPIPYLPSSVSASEISASYSPAADTAALKGRPGEFERLRNHYPLRAEVGF